MQTNKAQHTPGPWNASGPILQRQVVGPHGHIIVGKVGREAKDNASAVEANARLIAAAPDLLAVLQEYVKDNHRTGSVGYLYSRAQAAIAKATGA